VPTSGGLSPAAPSPVQNEVERRELLHGFLAQRMELLNIYRRSRGVGWVKWQWKQRGGGTRGQLCSPSQVQRAQRSRVMSRGPGEAEGLAPRVLIPAPGSPPWTGSDEENEGVCVCNC